MPYRCRAGRPIPFVQLRIVDANMKDVAHDGVSQGEVVVRTPWLTQGYCGEPERSEELWLGGWLHTGDVGVIDADGYLKIVDRIKDVVKTGGEWVSSLDIEDLILRVPGIAEAAVIGVPDEKWGERPVAFVVVKAGCRHAADRGGDKTARRRFRQQGNGLEVRGPRSRALRRRDPENQRRQARQEADPREARGTEPGRPRQSAPKPPASRPLRRPSSSSPAFPNHMPGALATLVEQRVPNAGSVPRMERGNKLSRAAWVQRSTGRSRRSTDA